MPIDTDNMRLHARITALTQRNPLINYCSGLPQSLPPICSVGLRQSDNTSESDNSETKSNWECGKPSLTDENVLPTIKNLRMKAAKHAAALGL